MLSWSQITTYLACQRAWELKYIHNLEKPANADSRPLILGKAVHAGIQAGLQTGKTSAAVAAARDYITDSTNPNATYYDWETGKDVVDEDYYAMMQELAMLAPDIVGYYLPRLGIPELYRVATMQDVFPDRDDLENPDEQLLEWHIEYGKFQGYIDAVLVDQSTGQIVLADWKVRTSFPREMLIEIDGQLQLYAALVAKLGGRVDRIIQVNIRNKVPKPAKINQDGVTPSKAAQDTTWERWVETLPVGIDPAKWEEIVRPKLHPFEDFLMWVETALDEQALEAAYRNAVVASESIESTRFFLKYYDRECPAILSTTKCQFCEFKRLCSGPLRYGGDPTEVIEREYQERQSD